MASPIASLAPLYFPDGSASYTSPNGDQILGSVNGPIEAGRRDAQKPEEATIGVVVKSGVGISGVGERYVEGILRGILSRVILVREKSMPRKGIVITLVVLKNTGADGKVAERGGSVSATSSSNCKTLRVLIRRNLVSALPFFVGRPLLTSCYQVSSDLALAASHGSSSIAICCNPALYDIHFCIGRGIPDWRTGSEPLKLPH